MAISIPAIVDAQLLALQNSLKPVYHAETTTFSSPSPPYALANRAAEILRMLTGLIDSGTMTVQGIHGLADAADQIITADADDPTTGYALANAIKAAYNLHIAKTAGDVHWAADVTNAVGSPDADTEGKLITLTNEIKTAFSAHFIFLTGNTHRYPDTKEVYLPDDADSYATCYVILNAIKPKYNAHVVDIGCAVSGLGDTSAFTGTNSLVGSKATFAAGTTTVALRGISGIISANTVSKLSFNPVLPATPVTGDTYVLEYSAVDSDLAVLEQGKGSGDGSSNPYGAGPSLVNAIMLLIAKTGGVVPSYLDIHSAEPFHLGSPHAGAGSQGMGGAMLLADALQVARDSVAAYTKPA